MLSLSQKFASRGPFRLCVFCFVVLVCPTFLHFGTTSLTQLFPVPVLESAIAPRSPGFSVVPFSCLDVTLAVERAREYMYKRAHTHTHT